MTPSTAQRLLVASFLSALGIAVYFEVKGNRATAKGLSLPDPRTFTGGAIVFGLLGILSLAAPELAALLGVGTVFGTAVRRYGADQPATAGPPAPQGQALILQTPTTEGTPSP